MRQKLFLLELKLAFCESNNGLFKLLVKQQVFSSLIHACCPTTWWSNHTLLTGNNSSALSCTVVALRDVEHFGENSHAQLLEMLNTLVKIPCNKYAFTNVQLEVYQWGLLCWATTKHKPANQLLCVIG